MPLYNEYGPWLTGRLGTKVQKISVNAGFTCPNRDGTVGTGGCTFCNNQTFNPAYCDTHTSVAEQLERGKQFFAHKYPQMRYLAYFQAYTNTYAPTGRLVELYEEALRVDGVVGIVIGTRPDCMSEQLLDRLEQMSRRALVVVEYGVESVYDDTLRRINRGHTHSCTVDAIRRTARRGLPVGAHVILGLPGESRDMLLREADELSSLPITFLKLHQLQLIRGTRMADEYAANPSDFHIFTADEYAELVADFVERLRPGIVLERFVSQSPASLLATPGWGMKNHEFVEKVKRIMTRRATFQGRLYHA